LKDTRDCDDLLKRVDRHLSRISAIIDEPENQNHRVFREEHMELEDDIAQFIIKTRKNRSELFKIVELDVEVEKL